MVWCWPIISSSCVNPCCTQADSPSCVAVRQGLSAPPSHFCPPVLCCGDVCPSLPGQSTGSASRCITSQAASHCPVACWRLPTSTHAWAHCGRASCRSNPVSWAAASAGTLQCIAAAGQGIQTVERQCSSLVPQCERRWRGNAAVQARCRRL